MTSNRVTEIVQTCGACPSQWEGRLEDGSHFYARFRYGTLRVSVASTLEAAISGEADDGRDTRDLFFRQISDSLDGVMSTDDMLNWAGLVMA